MQFANRAEVEVQVLGIELETFGELIDRLLELHQSNSDVLDLFRRKRLRLKASDRLTLHQLANEFDKAEHEFHDGALHIVRIGIPAHRNGGFPPARSGG